MIHLPSDRVARRPRGPEFLLPAAICPPGLERLPSMVRKTSFLILAATGVAALLVAQAVTVQVLFYPRW